MTLKDDLLKHQIFLQRLGASHGAAIISIINQGIDKAVTALKNKPEGLSKVELRQLHRDIALTLHTISGSQLKLLTDLALYEAQFIADRLFARNTVENVSTPSAVQIQKKLNEIKMSLYTNSNTKHSVGKTLTQFANIKASEIILKTGDVSVSDVQDKPEELRHTLSGLAVGLFASQALTLGKTTVTQAASVARQEVYVENNIPSLDWVTELDSDVCEECEALGNRGPYPVTDSDIPPEHWNCRCVLVPSDE